MRLVCKCLVGVSCVGVFLLAWTTPVWADEFNKETIFIFSAPVELPGISLPAGTYMFKLVDPSGAHSAVGVFDRTGMTCYGTFLTIPDVRVPAPDRPAVTFEERGAHAPEAISSWFYPGDQTGREFIYSSHRNS